MPDLVPRDDHATAAGVAAPYIRKERAKALALPQLDSADVSRGRPRKRSRSRGDLPGRRRARAVASRPRARSRPALRPRTGGVESGQLPGDARRRVGPDVPQRRPVGRPPYPWRRLVYPVRRRADVARRGDPSVQARTTERLSHASLPAGRAWTASRDGGRTRRA